MKRLLLAALTTGALAAGLLTTALPAQASAASPASTGSTSAGSTSVSPAPSGPTVNPVPAGSPTVGSAGPSSSPSTSGSGQPPPATQPPSGQHAQQPTTTPTAAKDTTPPGPVTDLGLTGNTISSVTLGWTDPTDADLAHVIVRRATGSTPPATGQGTLVATLAAKATSYTDKSLATGTAYSYALFAQDKTGNLSNATTVTVATAATDAHTGIQGKLTDSAGHGIGNVLVHVATNGIDAANAVTTSTGAYTVTNLTPGTYTVCYEPTSNVSGPSISGYLAECYHQQSYQPATATPVTVRAGAMTSNVNDTLAAGAGLSGLITDPTGAPLTGTVTITTGSTLTTRSAADGIYEFKNLPPSTTIYQLCFQPDQNAGPSPYPYLPTCGGSYLSLSAGTMTSQNLTVNVGGVLTGVVRDSAGNPVAGASVDMPIGAAAVSDASGRYQVTGLRDEIYSVCGDGSTAAATSAAPYGFVNDCRSYTYSQVSVHPNQIITYDITLTSNGALGGTLTKSDGSPAAYTSVDIYGPYYYPLRTVTDGAGNWQQAVPPGSYDVCYQTYDSVDIPTCHGGQGYRNNDVPSGTPVAVTAATLTTLNDSFLKGGVLAGTVTAPDGTPLANVEVRILVPSGDYALVPAFTDSNGHYQAGHLLPGDYWVCFDASWARQSGSPGYRYQCYGTTPGDPSAPTVAVRSGVTTVADMQLTYGAAVAGHVTDSAGDAVSSVNVVVTDLTTNTVMQDYTDDNGDFGFFGLPADDYTVCYDPTNAWVPADGYTAPPTGFVAGCWQNEAPQRAPDPVHTVAGSISQTDITLATGGEVNGTLTDSGGNPIMSATVNVMYADGTEVTGGYTDYYGHYQIDSLPAVPVAICFDASWQGFVSVCYANAADYQSATLVTVGAGQTLTIDQQLATSPTGQADVNRPSASTAISRKQPAKQPARH